MFLSGLLISILYIHPIVHERLSCNALLNELDRSIEEGDGHYRRKEERIRNLKRDLSEENEFHTCHRIFEEYKYFQYDSAYVYARRLERLSNESGDLQEKSVASSALLFCYKSVGFFNEATSLIRNYRPEGVSNQELMKFYILCSSTYQNLSSYVSGSDELSREYDQLKLSYYKKALRHTPPDSFERAWISLEIGLVEHYSDSLAIQGRADLVTNFHLDEHELAVQYSILASSYQSLGKTDEAVRYRVLSAICDLRSCTRETTSAKVLAEMMYRRNDISRAYRYIQQALRDAQFYNSRLRMVEINSIMPMIEKKRSAWFNNQILILSVFAMTVVTLLLVTFVLLRKIKRRNRTINEAHEVILRNSELLRQNNESLTALNDKLHETNEIKDQYIIQTLYGNTDFVNDVEKEALAAIRKIATRQYEDARAILYNLPIKEEREKIYASFDAAFLKLFPNFIEEFNKLFPDGQRIPLDGPKNLPMEVRIFALMRLGIGNTAQVAEYLNLSVNTVYVYKTKLKSRSKVGKEDFDRLILAIPKP